MAIYNKKELRKIMKEKRLSLTIDEVRKYSQNVIDKIKADPNYQKATTVGIYMPFRNEVDLTPLIKDNKTFVVPVIKESNEIYFSRFDRRKMIFNKLGILEPKVSDPVEEIDYLLIPALAVYNNYRVGFGKGYYDRFLEKHDIKYRVAVIYWFQEVEFKLEPHDIQNIDYTIIGD